MKWFLYLILKQRTGFVRAYTRDIELVDTSWSIEIATSLVCMKNQVAIESGNITEDATLLVSLCTFDIVNVEVLNMRLFEFHIQQI